jgi:FkbM family methyltransferase
VHNVAKQCRHGLVIYNRHDVYIGRSFELYGEYSLGECQLFEQIVQPGDVVIEVGANIGAHTLRLAQLAGPLGRVHAFEPQRIVFQTLCANLAINSITNTHCYLQGVGSTTGELPIPPIDYERPNNFGGVSFDADAPYRSSGANHGVEVVPLVVLDRVFASLDRLRFLKIDVEGMELDVLLGGRELINRTRPLLYVENDRPAKAEALVATLRALGYDLYWHTPLLYNPANYFGNPENVFAGIISINVFGVPSEAAARLDGFSRVDSATHPLFARQAPATGESQAGGDGEGRGSTKALG